MYIELDENNDSFVESREEEVVKILREIIHKVQDGEEGGIIRDSNENSIGAWSFEYDG